MSGNKKCDFIDIPGKRISFSNILSSSFLGDNLNTYYQNTLSFIRDWLSGKEVFDLQTSGSTGVPKVITVSRAQLTYSALASAKALNLLPGYSALVCLNTKYIAGIMMMVRSLVTGMKMRIIEPSSNPLETLSASDNFDFTAWVPLQMEKVLDCLPENEVLLNKFKCIIVGGAPVSASLQSKINNITVPVYLTYGMTETLSHIALQKLNGPDADDYFQALDEVELGIDSRGCLTVKSPVTLNETIVTNDLVELLERNRFRFLGRLDNVINSGGVKILPEKIEALLDDTFLRLGLSRRFFIFGTPDERLGEQVTLFIEGETLSEEEKSLTFSVLKANLSSYEIPKEIRFINSFIETATGKVNRKATAEI
ncbi:MAG TPA: AMP-binding protein [Cytophagales bacterium]|nr:AMP-binding protein [Cytophagales bacterium]